MKFYVFESTLAGLPLKWKILNQLWQVCNAYTELNDPAVQRARFEQQAKDKVVSED